MITLCHTVPLAVNVSFWSGWFARKYVLKQRVGVTYRDFVRVYQQVHWLLNV